MNPLNLRIETPPPTKQGGQHCGPSTTTVTITHIPSGLSATCSCERSQMKNRQVAISMVEWGMSELGIQDP